MSRNLSAEEIDAIVQKLERAARDGTHAALTQSEAGISVAQAKEVARRLDQYLAPGARVRKLGATTFAARQALDIDNEFFSSVPLDKTLRSNAEIPAAALRHRKVEAEPAFRFHASISRRGPAPTDARVADAVGAVLPAFEIPETRYSALGVYGGPALVADAGAAGWAVLGEEKPFTGPDCLDDAAFSLRMNGEEVSSGTASAIDGGPFAALVRYCEAAHAAGLDTPEGLVVLAGACTACVEAPPDATVVADAGDLGSVRLTISSTPITDQEEPRR